MSSRTPHRVRLLLAAVALLVAGVFAVGAGGAAADSTTFRVLVVKATSGPEPFTDDEVDAAMRAVAAFYATASFGQVAITYMQTPWLTGALDPASCQDEAAELPPLATAAGWNLADYDRIVFLFGAHTGCAGSFFHTPNTVYVNEVAWVGLIAHELGHSFGMGHAGTLTCWPARTGRSCTGDPYGDNWDLMGGAASSLAAYVYDPGALQKACAGWLTPTYVTKPGVYQLAPLELPSALPQALVIRTAAYEYWIDERAALGNDLHLAGLPVTRGFAVHRVSGDPLAQGADTLTPDYLIPNARPNSYYTAPGKTFTLPGVFTLTALSRSHGVTTIRFRWLHSSA